MFRWLMRRRADKAYMQGYADGRHDAIRHGQWLKDKNGKIYCSECGCYSNRESNYCPAFGEKMDRGDNGE